MLQHAESDTLAPCSGYELPKCGATNELELKFPRAEPSLFYLFLFLFLFHDSQQEFGEMVVACC